MLTGVHVLLSYACLFECDHCFLHCSPGAGGTFTLGELEELLNQAVDTGSVRSFAFEGGEPFLFYPIMERGVALAHGLGFRTEVVTNGYWALDPKDAEHWLAPLVRAGLDVMSVSDDEYHHGKADPSPARAAIMAAKSLGIEGRAFTIDPPEARPEKWSEQADKREKGQPIVGGSVRFRGRAADKLTPGLPLVDWREFDQCPDEDFAEPKRVHVDAFGNVHLCQGVCIGNVWRRPLKEIMEDYDPESHPICGPLLRGGPAALARGHGLDRGDAFIPGGVDACHFCYRTRKALLTGYPNLLTPDLVYGKQ